MTQRSASLAGLQCEYRQLRRSLARIGYISSGSVQERSVATSARTGYQWTRKVDGKTVSLSLSPQQFEAMKQAVANKRTLFQTLKRMEQISRQILFQSLPDTRRRKRLTKKVLGIN